MDKIYDTGLYLSMLECRGATLLIIRIIAPGTCADYLLSSDSYISLLHRTPS